MHKSVVNSGEKKEAWKGKKKIKGTTRVRDFHGERRVSAGRGSNLRGKKDGDLARGKKENTIKN